MKQPPMFEEVGKENEVCKLKRSIYGLKQLPRCWNTAFNQFLLELGFDRSKEDPCLYIGMDFRTLITLYMDDLVLITESDEEMAKLKKQLASRFKMVDMGPLHYILGIKVGQLNAGIHLSQEACIWSMLKKFHLENAKPMSTPVDSNVVLSKEDEAQPVDGMTYRSMVGSILYCALATWPDIQCAVMMVAKFKLAPKQSHLTVVKRILQYLKETPDFGLMYTRETGDLHGYCDTDYARDVDDRKSVTTCSD